ncbi:MAG: helix-turn-helix domain-containing protein [Lachnospiraceae bacterium]|nr:helix-turn-helix domain-containing protein [Lachnospiraceae bacterium]
MRKIKYSIKLNKETYHSAKVLIFGKSAISAKFSRQTSMWRINVTIHCNNHDPIYCLIERDPKEQRVFEAYRVDGDLSDEYRNLPITFDTRKKFNSFIYMLVKGGYIGLDKDGLIEMATVCHRQDEPFYERMLTSNMQKRGGNRIKPEMVDINDVNIFNMDETLRLLKTFRRAKSMTLEDAAKAIGVSKRQYQRIEHGETTVSANRLCEILKVLGFTIYAVRDSIR